MKKTIFYWSPCLNPVGTVKSTLNSATSLMKYNEEKFEAKKLVNLFKITTKVDSLMNLGPTKVIKNTVVNNEIISKNYLTQTDSPLSALNRPFEARSNKRFPSQNLCGNLQFRCRHSSNFSLKFESWPPIPALTATVSAIPLRPEY